MVNSLETRLAPLALQLRTGQLKLSDYLKELEARFTAINKQIQAFLPEDEEDRFKRLRREAAQLEQRYPDPANRPLLYGVPVGIKDIFHVDGYLTRAGSRLPPKKLTGPEAKVVTLLKEAGALILGKTVTTEFAYFEPGPTRNPHNPAHTPGGSSSGSAAAVAAGLCPLALGTQTIGSIIRPAAFCGIVGYKPTAGVISTRGTISLSPSLDHVGFFTQDLAGVGLAGPILCKRWREPKGPLERPVLGVPTGPYLEKAGDEALAHFKAVQRRLEDAGFTIVAVDAMPDLEDIVGWHMDLMAGQMAIIHENLFAEYRALYNPKTAALIERGHQVAPESIQVYRAEREWLRSELRALMTTHNISVWISPSARGTAPEGIQFTGDPIMNLPWTYAGVPTIGIPSGTGKNGMPLGLQLSADCYHDAVLVQWARQISDALATPQSVPTPN